MPLFKNAIIIDIETLDTATTACVFEIGALHVVDDKVVDTFAVTLNVVDQLFAGRTINQGTVEWHLGQKKNATEEYDQRDKWTPHRTPDALTKLLGFVESTQKYGPPAIWSRGTFDTDILASLYGSFDRKEPWKYWQVRDARSVENTLLEIMGLDGKEFFGDERKGAHMALADCRWQLDRLLSLYENFTKQITPIEDTDE